jgi:hypothetical protein
MQIQHHQLLRPKVPRYRGLVRVVREEDVKKGGDKVTLRILRRKVNAPSSSGVEDDAAECAQEQASKEKERERAVVGAMAGLGGEMDVDVDGGSSDSISIWMMMS